MSEHPCSSCQGTGMRPEVLRRSGKCRAFIRREKPHGYNIVCQSDATGVFYTEGPNGEHVFHGIYCDRHREIVERGFQHAVSQGWRLVWTNVRCPVCSGIGTQPDDSEPAPD